MDPNPSPSDLQTAYARFAKDGHAVVEALAAHLASVADVDRMPVLPKHTPRAFEASLAPIGAAPQGELLGELERVIAAAQHVHHPRFIGHQVNAPLPNAALAALTNAVLNNSSAVFEMGPVGVVMERQVVRFLCGTIGWTPTSETPSGGVLTHGGSLGNLTALLAMRQAKVPGNAWVDGTTGSSMNAAALETHRFPNGFAVLASADSHYCIQRAVQIMGWGRDGVQPVATLPSGALDPADLPRALERAKAKGRRVLCVAASSCNTALGAFDDLNALADFCAEHALWLHVDAAHGGPFLLGKTTRHVLAGIERADSVVWDLHKMMLMPSLITGVLFKNNAHAAAALAQDASYLFKSGDDAIYDLGHMTIECTKPTIGVTAYLTLSLHGTDFFARYVEQCYALAQAFAETIRAHPAFELAADPMGNIVCFRHLGSGEGLPHAEVKLNALQERLRAELVASGAAYIVMATVRGARYLRTTIINPMTTQADLAFLLTRLDHLATP